MVASFEPAWVDTSPQPTTKTSSYSRCGKVPRRSCRGKGRQADSVGTFSSHLAWGAGRREIPNLAGGSWHTAAGARYPDLAAVRQIRAVRRLGIAGAGRDRVRTPERAGLPSAPPAERPSLPPAPKEPSREPAPEVAEQEERAPAGPARAGSVKAEKPDEESEYEYTDNSDGEEAPEKEEAGLKAVPKAAASQSERSEIPRRRAPEESERRRSRDRVRDTPDRGRRRRSRSRRHQRRDEEGHQAEPRKKKRHRKGHRQAPEGVESPERSL